LEVLILTAKSGNRAKVNATGNDPPFVVYLPSIHAAAHLRVLGHAFDSRCPCGRAIDYPTERTIEPVHVFNETLKPVPELKDVLQAVVDTGAVLATGHLSVLKNRSGPTLLAATERSLGTGPFCLQFVAVRVPFLAEQTRGAGKAV
jgi:hypothetical protein